MQNPLLKTWHKMVSIGSREAIRDVVEPQQVVLSQGGAAILECSVRESLELNKDKDWVCLKLDVTNAFKEICCAETVKVFSEERSIRHLAAYTAVTLAPCGAVGVSSGAHRGKVGVRGTPRQVMSSV